MESRTRDGKVSEDLPFIVANVLGEANIVTIVPYSFDGVCKMKPFI